MKIAVKDISKPQEVDVEWLDHDCYALNDYTIEEYTYYSPTPQKIDEGTDHDETGLIAVCNKCGADMPEIDAYAEQEDYYGEGVED